MGKDTLAQLWKEYEDYLETDDTDQSWRMKFPSGILALNQALGDSEGVPWGIMQLIGDEAHGKTTLSFDFLAQAQRKGLKEVKLPDGRLINAAILDFERTYDPKYARINGVDTSKVLKLVTPYAETSFDITLELMAQGLQFIIIDSIPMLIPKSEDGKSMEDSSKMASEASVLGRGMKRMNQIGYNADALIICINQWRSNITNAPHASEKKPYGARIFKHIAKYNIELSRVSRDHERMTINAFVAKTKAGANGRKIEYDIKQGKGIDYAAHVIALAIDYDIVQMAGKGRYSYGELKAHGKDAATSTFPIEEISAKVMKAMREEDNDGE